MIQSQEGTVDEKSAQFLRAVEYYGGEATKTEIRARTGLSHNESSYRFGKLEELGLITVRKAERGMGERNPRVAELTSEARREIDRGLLGEDEEDAFAAGDVEVSEADFRELGGMVEQLQHRVNVLTQSGVDGQDDADSGVRESLERLEERVERLQDGTGESMAADDVARAPAVKTIESRLGELEDEVDELESYVFEFSEAVETQLYAMQQAMEENMNISLAAYKQTEPE
jgi:archaellum component FlaC